VPHAIYYHLIAQHAHILRQCNHYFGQISNVFSLAQLVIGKIQLFKMIINVHYAIRIAQNAQVQVINNASHVITSPQ